MRNRGTAVVFKHGKVLLVRDKGKHHFSLPGGGIHKGEPSVSAAARELYEELGLSAIKVTRMRQCDFKSPATHHKVCLIEVSGEPHLKGHELNKFIWWDIRSKVPVYAHVNQILRKIKS